jgi:hypothetical protein
MNKISSLEVLYRQLETSFDKVDVARSQIIEDVKAGKVYTDDEIIGLLPHVGGYTFAESVTGMPLSDRIMEHYILPTGPLTMLALLEGGYSLPNGLSYWLSREDYIIDKGPGYDRTLLNLFKDNSIMLRKWQRYAERIRNS